MAFSCGQVHQPPMARMQIKVHALNFVSGRVRDTWQSYASVSCMYVVRSNYDTNLDFVVYLLHLYVQLCIPLKYSMKMLERVKNL